MMKETQKGFAMTEQTKREKILQRVLNLRAKAENDGASESEMREAFSMASKLMESYEIEEAELALAESEGRIVLDVVSKKADTSALKGKHRHKITLCISAIAKFTQTKSAYNTGTGAITYVGHRPDTELANYLTAVVREALDREYENYRKSNVSVGYGAKASFQTAMASRVSNRLYRMAEEAEQERQSNKKRAQIENSNEASSNALVVCEIAEQKRKEVDTAFTKNFPKLRTASGFSFAKNRTAFGAGREAGDRLQLGKSVGGTKTKKIA